MEELVPVRGNTLWECTLVIPDEEAAVVRFWINVNICIWARKAFLFHPASLGEKFC